MLLQLKLIANSHGLAGPNPQLLEEAKQSAIAYGQRLQRDYPEFPQTSFKTFPEHISEHILLYLAAKRRAATSRPAHPNQSWLPSGWEGWTPRSTLVASLLTPKSWLTVRHVLDCDFGSLRQAKVAAWYWLDIPSWEGRE